jgi:hypothetical protein
MQFVAWSTTRVSGRGSRRSARTGSGTPRRARCCARARRLRRSRRCCATARSRRSRSTRTSPRGALLYPRRSREELEGRFLGPMTYPDPKGERNNSMSGKRRSSSGVRGGASRDPRDMAKAGLPESQSPDDAKIHPPERRLLPAPRSASPGKDRKLDSRVAGESLPGVPGCLPRARRAIGLEWRVSVLSPTTGTGGGVRAESADRRRLRHRMLRSSSPEARLWSRQRDVDRIIPPMDAAWRRRLLAHAEAVTP